MASILCTTAMCSQGRASVEQMRETFDTLITNPSFNKSYFEPTVISIEKSFQDQWSIFSEWVPFNPACCAIKDIGAQADGVTGQMLRSIDAVSPGTGPGSIQPPIGGDQLTTLIMLALGAVIVSNISTAVKR